MKTPRQFLQSLVILFSLFIAVPGRAQTTPPDLSEYKTVDTAIKAKFEKAAVERTSSQSAHLGLQLEEKGRGKFFVASVEAQSPAAAAGVAVGDEIKTVEGKPVPAMDVFREVVLSKAPGDTLKIAVQRKKGKADLTLTLGAASHPLSASNQNLFREVRVSGEDSAKVERVTANSNFADAGLKTGDVIQKIDSAPVATGEQFNDMIAEKRPGDTVSLTVQREGEVKEVKVKLSPPADTDPARNPFEYRPTNRWTKPVYRLAVVPIDYPDVEHNAKITPEAWEKSFFSSGSYTGESATGQAVHGSLNDLYQEQSCGVFHVEGKCFAHVKVDRKRADYSNDRVRTALLTETLDKVSERDGVDALKDFDGVIFIYSGGRYQTNRGNLYWPHRSNVQYKGRRLPYVIVPEGGTVMGNISVVAHEFGHLMGLPDLYARPEQPGSEGLGKWCLMSQQNGNGRPQHMSAWCKEQLGWLKPTVIDPTVKQKLILSPVEGSAKECFKVIVKQDGSEYFLLECRAKRNFDQDLPGEGLLIWRVVDNRPVLEESHGVEGPSGPNVFLTQVPFPTHSNASFTPYTTPTSKSQKGGGLPVYITNIQKLPDGRIAFQIGYEYL